MTLRDKIKHLKKEIKLKNDAVEKIYTTIWPLQGELKRLQVDLFLGGNFLKSPTWFLRIDNNNKLYLDADIDTEEGYKLWSKLDMGRNHHESIDLENTVTLNISDGEICLSFKDATSSIRFITRNDLKIGISKNLQDKVRTLHEAGSNLQKIIDSFKKERR